MGNIFECWRSKSTVVPEVKAVIKPVTAIHAVKITPSNLNVKSTVTPQPEISSDNKVKHQSKRKTVSGHYSKLLSKNGNIDIDLIFERAKNTTPINIHEPINMSFISSASYGSRIDSQIRQAIKEDLKMIDNIEPVNKFVTHVKLSSDIRVHQRIGNSIMGAEYDIYADGNIIDIKVSKNDIFGKKQYWAQLLIYASLMFQINSGDTITNISLYDVGRGQIIIVPLDGIDLERVYRSIT